jgi:hypothetical protein
MECKGMFIVKQIPSVVNTDIIPKCKSLPDQPKDVLMNRDQAIIM